MRYDQFMKFGWKVLIPVSLFWILVVSTLRVMTQQHTSRAIVAAVAVGVVLIVFATSNFYESNKRRRANEDALGEVAVPNFPVPHINKAGE